MNTHKSETQKSQKIFHFDEHHIEQICANLENGMHCKHIGKLHNYIFKQNEVMFH